MPTDYLHWAFREHILPSSLADASTTSYFIGLSEFCEDCDPDWAKAKGALCLRREVLAGALDTPLRAWLRAQTTPPIADRLLTGPTRQERPVERVDVVEYIGKSYQDMLRVWASKEGHDGEIIVVQICRALTTVGLFESKRVASNTLYGALRDGAAFQHVRSGTWRPLTE